MPLDMRNVAIEARQDLAFAMSQAAFPVEEIRSQLGYSDSSSVYRACAAGLARSLDESLWTSRRKFGVEIEFLGCRKDAVIDSILREDSMFPVEAQQYNHRVQKVWKLVTDASVNGTGLEMVSPILSGDEGFRQLKLVLKHIKMAGGVIDRSCGVHVHHNAQDLTPHSLAELVRFYALNQPQIDMLLAPARRASRGNSWCQPMSEYERDRIIRQAKEGNAKDGWNGYDRYRALNVTAYPRYGSVEFRQHQGSLNYDKISNWVKFGQAIVESVSKMTSANEMMAPTFNSLPEMLASLRTTGGLSKAAAKYLQERSDGYAARH